jgi:hypothetical protein
MAMKASYRHYSDTKKTMVSSLFRWPYNLFLANIKISAACTIIELICTRITERTRTNPVNVRGIFPEIFTNSSSGIRELQNGQGPILSTSEASFPKFLRTVLLVFLLYSIYHHHLKCNNALCKLLQPFLLHNSKICEVNIKF